MPESMTLANLTTELQLSLQDCRKYFDSSDATTQAANYRRLIMAAVSDMCIVVPRSLCGTITLVADQARYTAPVDMWLFKYAEWGTDARHHLRAWEPGYPRDLPLVTFEADEIPSLLFSPAPTANQLVQLGSEFTYWYMAKHTWLDDGTTSIQEIHRERLLLRALAEAMKTLAVARIGQSTQVKIGIGASKKGEPSALYADLMTQWRASA